jgi:hypothetical protein
MPHYPELEHQVIKGDTFKAFAIVYGFWFRINAYECE